MQLPSTYYKNNSRVVAGTPIIYQDDVILLCDTSAAPVVINLLEIPNDQWLTTYKLYIIDNSGNASVNNITINAGVGQTINNAPSVVISTNGECALVRIVGNSQYVSTSAGGSVSNPLEVLDEGVPLTPNAASMNFVGSGVTATSVGDNVTVTINTPTATTLAVTDTDTIDLTLTGGPAYNLSANMVDTGWVDLLGFDYVSVLVGRPQCRRIGKVIHFRGNVTIPLSSDGGATLIPLNTATTYFDQLFKAPWTGSDITFGNGVSLNSFGSITFNLNNSVIPTSVHSGSFDGSYANQIIGTRVLKITANETTALSAYFLMVITNNGLLRIGTLKDLEEGAGFTNFFPSSPLRFITSYTRSSNYLPDYIGATSYIHNVKTPPPGAASLDVDPVNNQWGLSLDAAEETDIGGFTFRLDGLMAYIT